MLRTVVFFGSLFLCAHTVSAQDNASDRIMSYQAYHEEAAKLDHEKHNLSLSAFLEKYEQGDVVIFDLRHETSYANGHIKGATHLGAGDITKEILAEKIPSNETTVLLYCDNSLYLTRMMSLTDLSYPQFVLQGYPETYMLKAAWEHEGKIVDGVQILKDKGIWETRDEGKK